MLCLNFGDLHFSCIVILYIYCSLAVCSSFLLIAVLDECATIYVLSHDGHLGDFYIFAIVNNSTMNVLVCIPCGTYTSGLLNHRGQACSTIEADTEFLSKMFTQIYICNSNIQDIMWTYSISNMRYCQTYVFVNQNDI